MCHVQRTLTGLCIVMAASVATSIAMAEDKKAANPMDRQAMTEAYEKLAAPGEQHKQMSSLAGMWTVKTKEWMEPDKAAVETTGAADMKMLLDGRYLQEDVTGQMMGKPFSGIVITAYDNLLKRYVMNWMSTMGTGIFTMEGTPAADGKTITLEGQHAEPGGGFMKHRAVWTIVDNNNQTFDMYGAHHGGKEWKMMEMTYTRKQQTLR